MIKKYTLLLFITLFPFALLAQTGKIVGKVIDKDSKEGVPFAAIVAKLNGLQKAGVATDFDGKFVLGPLVPGSYDIEVSYVGYQPQIVKGFTVNAERSHPLTIEISATSEVLQEVEVVTYKTPLINKDNTTTGGTIEAKEIAKLPTRSVNSMIQTQAAVTATDDGAELNFKGNRGDANLTFINGVKIIGRTPTLPPAALQEVNIMTGGIPAQYGDVVGGVTSITTKGPSSKFFGGVEYETSKGILNVEGYDLASFNLSGPLLFKSMGDSLNPGLKRPVLGFFLTGQYNGIKDSSPNALGYWVAKDSVQQALEKSPLIRSGESYIPATNGILLKDLTLVQRAPNAGQQDFTGNMFIDFQPTENLTFAFGGSINYNSVMNYFPERALFNASNHSRFHRLNWNAFGRVTQSFKTKENSVVKNAYYTIQLDYSQSNSVNQDLRNRRNFWQYAYYGKFNTEFGFRPVDFKENLVVDKDTFDFILQERNVETKYDFIPADYNPIGANQNIQLYDSLRARNIEVTNFFDVLQYGGLGNGFFPQTAWGIYDSPGRPQGSYTETNNNQVRLSAIGQAQVKNHSLKFGFEYEQRRNTSYSASPSNLWLTARFAVNGQLRDSIPYIVKNDSILAGFDTVRVRYIEIANGPGSYFDQKMREKFNIGKDERINIDAYTPDQMSVDMFSANDLLYNSNYFSRFNNSYSGYTYDGRRDNRSITFRDFFADSVNRPMGAFNPIYMAGFIEDKFQIDDLILRLGLRVDRFDANQQVLRDPYSFAKLKTAGDVDLGLLGGGRYVKPENVQDDWVVYVDKRVDENVNLNSLNVVGYRKEFQWYDANGKEMPNSNHVLIDNVANPLIDLKESFATDELSRKTWSENKLTLDAFQDYKPQINVMPRASFSFPISEDALFFAHYDILTQRPGSNFVTPYLYTNVAQGAGVLLPNANLRPSRKVDYQLGFQQKISASSAVTLSAFYSDLKDQVQSIKLNAAFPTTYSTYGNIDFGNVKGMTFQYDLRRTGNIRITSSYTLQFANGTGSSATSNLNFSSQTQQFFRVPVPLEFDQRHNIKFNFDYRYDKGEGPVLFDKKILENAGLNFTLNAGSGLPYSGQSNIVANFIGANNTPFIEGGINGTRLPWNIRAGLRLDKDFEVKVSNKEGANPLFLNVYCYVQNLFNTMNILGVYRPTGSPTDDGYLASGLAQNLDQSLIDLYTVRMVYGESGFSNFSIPRRVRIGISLSF
jgi:hypothetical protein